ncbi:unnamed protein product [Moneuplotes crassus]|uniref:Uncharacterized protein n=1 Tax=Euplotes crassus TaxID=5936 RepID=A0AAD1ULT3_EUPCR|nr:unnamed protein product [Moneuplotes crassus]
MIYHIPGVTASISPYLNELVGISFKVLKEMKFQDFLVKSSQLKRLITSFKHVNALKFYSCKLTIHNIPDFSKSLENTKIRELSFAGSSFLDSTCALALNKPLSTPRSNLSLFLTLLKGLGSSPCLNLSLQTLNLQSCLTRAEIQEVLASSGLSRVKFKI